VETENPDGDAFNNLQEYIADTDPTNPNSYLRLLVSDGVPEVNPSSSGRDYQIYSSLSLSPPSWQVETSFSGNGGSVTYPVNLDGQPKYFRLGVSVP
jgi:hypothetical protein